MKGNEIVIIADYNASTSLTLTEIIEITQTSEAFIQELIDFGILIPRDQVFSLEHLQRIKTVQHLQQDLEINMAGAAMVLELLDQIDEMEERLAFFERMAL